MRRLSALLALLLVATCGQNQNDRLTRVQRAAAASDRTVSIQTNDRTHFVVAEDGGGSEGTFVGWGPWQRPTGLARADRVAAGAWETLAVRGAHDVDVVGLQAPNGAWLSAQPDGTLTFNRHRDEPFTPEAWESFRVERVTGDGGVALITAHGTYVRAPDQGGGTLRHDPRDGPGIDETFWPSAPLRGPPPSSFTGGIRGQLRLEPGGGYVDDQGPVLPLFVHFGDALSRWSRGQQEAVAADLDRIKAARWDGARVWTTLGEVNGATGGGFWAGRAIGPEWTPNYWAHVEAFLTAVRDRGLKVHLAQGDIRRVAIRDRRDFAHRMADVVNRVGPEVVAIFEGVNESRDTGEPDAAALAQFVAWFHERCPSVLVRGLSAYTGTEDPEILNAFSRAPANVFLVHGYRGGRFFDKTRHIFSLQYEVGARIAASRAADRTTVDIVADLAGSRARTLRDWANYLERHYPQRNEHVQLRARAAQTQRAIAEADGVRLTRLVGWQGEPPGFGALVSAIDNRHEIDQDTYTLMAAMALMTRQAYVWFSGPGVISDHANGERLEAMPGFWTVAPTVKASLPADVMRFNGGLYHSGTTWAHKRQYEAVGENRADCVDHADGRWACVLYGPEPDRIRQARPIAIEHDTVTGHRGHIVYGRNVH